MVSLAPHGHCTLVELDVRTASVKSLGDDDGDVQKGQPAHLLCLAVPLALLPRLGWDLTIHCGLS